MVKNRNTKRIASLAVALLFSSGLLACSDSENAQTLISEAKAYQQKGEPKAAIIQLKNVLQKNPENAEARSLLGVIYHEAGDFQSAEKEIRKALELGANPADLLPVLGKVLLLQGQFQKVLDEVRQDAEAKPDARYLATQGNAYLGLGKTSEARESFQLALKENPDFADALIGSAKLALVERDADTAEKIVEQITTSSSGNVDAWLFKGDLLRAKGDAEGALAAYAKAIQLKPDAVSAYVATAHLQINEKKFEAARTALASARKQEPQSLLIAYTQSLLEFKEGKHAAALESIQQVLRAAPDHMPSVLLAGAVQFALGSTQQAEQHLKKFLERSPGHPYASRLLVATLLKNGETAHAVKVLAPLLNKEEKDFQLLRLAGETYMQARNYSKATEYFEKASALDPGATGVRTALGMSRLAQGENARGIAELEQAAELDANPTQAGILLVMTHMRLKEYDKAFTALNKLEKTQPGNPLLINLRGGIHLAKKDMVAARSSFEKALQIQKDYFPAVVNLAQMDVREKKPDAAKKRLESFLEVDQKNVQAMMSLADLALSQGAKDEATTWLERAGNMNPDDVKPALQLTAHYLRIGEKQKAFALAQKLQGSHPNDPDVLDMVAQTQLANDDRASALQSYKKLVGLAPDSALARFRIAAIHMAMDDQDAAAGALKVALSLKPDYLEAQLALASLEVRKGNPDQALKIARQIQQQPQSGAAGYLLEGDILMSQQKPGPALAAYEQAFTRNKNSHAVIKQHQALARAGKEQDGETRLSQWLKTHPEDTSTRTYLATAYFARGQNKPAITEYQTVLQAEPKNAGVLNNLALAYQNEKDARALEFAEKAYKLAPESAAVMDTLGWLLVEQGNLARGLPLLQKATSLAPEVLDIRYHLAYALLKSGEKAKARSEVEQMLASGKPFAKEGEAKALLQQLQ